MIKKIKKVFKFIGLFFSLTLFIRVFGIKSNINRFFIKKFVFTPFNIVFVILFILSLNKIWLGKKKSKILYYLFCVILMLPTCFSTLHYLFPTIMNKITNSISNFIISLVIIVFISIIIILTIKLIRKKDEITINNNSIIKSNLSKANNPNDLINLNCGYENIKKENIIKKEIANKTIQTNSNVASYYNKEKQNKISQTQINIIPAYNNTDKCIANRICPKCYNKLVARTNSYDGSYFLGCSAYGKTGCNFTINYKEYYNIKDKVKTY